MCTSKKKHYTNISLIRPSYYFLSVIPESRIITIGGYSGSYYDWDLSSDGFDNGEAEDCMIVEAGSVILLMVHQTS